MVVSLPLRSVSVPHFGVAQQLKLLLCGKHNLSSSFVVIKYIPLQEAVWDVLTQQVKCYVRWMFRAALRNHNQQLLFIEIRPIILVQEVILVALTFKE